MRIRRTIVLVFALVLVGAGAFWVSSSVADTPRMLVLPQQVVTECGVKGGDAHLVQIDGAGKFQESSTTEANPIVVKVGQQYKLKTGQKVAPLGVVAISGQGFAEGIGEMRYWLDPTRPVKSAIWEKTPGTEFPAIQEMRFHFFYTFEAMPGKVYRSMNPARMRSNNVRAFPPPSGTVYRLMEPVKLEEVSDPGVVVGQVLANRVVMR